MRHRIPLHREFFSQSAAGLRVVCRAVCCQDDALLAAGSLGLAVFAFDYLCLEPEEPKFVCPFLNER